MKKIIGLSILSLVIYSTTFCQTKGHKISKEDSLSKAMLKAAKPAPIDSNGPPPGTTVLVLNADQIKLLEYVIGESEAGYKSVNQLLQILRIQQYHPPVAKTDSTAGKKN